MARTHVAALACALRMDLTPSQGGRVTSLSVFFPAYNEEDIIEKTVVDAVRFLSGFSDDWEIIVVDDGSADRTAEIVQRFGSQEPRVRVVRHDRNRGYGAALRTGFTSAAKDVVFFCDADGQFNIAELAEFAPALAAAPVVAGYRIARSDPRHRLFIAKAYHFVIGMIFGVWLRDIDCAFKLLRREALQGLNLESDGAFISCELVIKLRRKAIAIVERGVHHYPRMTGYSKGASFGVILKTINDIVRLRLGLPLKPRARRVQGTA